MGVQQCSPPALLPLPAAGSPQRAITGLMIHCAADGLAMGAAALSGDMRLSMMIAVGRRSVSPAGVGGRDKGVGGELVAGWVAVALVG